MYETVPYFISEDKQQEAYDYLFAYLGKMRDAKKKMKEGKSAAERAITLVDRGDIAGKEFKKLNKTLYSVYQS